jgi:hypothetical protein
VRNLSHIGRAHDAVALAKNLIELPRHPKYNLPTRGNKSAGYGRTRLFEVLERYELCRPQEGHGHRRRLQRLSA